MNHISIEGMDGVGKSTTCRLLAKKIGYDFIEKPLHYLFDDNDQIVNYQKVVKKVNTNPNRNFTSLFYGLGSIYLYELFKDKNIITDRHLASNYAWSGTEYNGDVYDLIIRKLGVPKLTIILYSTIDVLIDRLGKRNKDDKDIARVSESEKIYSRMIGFCKTYHFPFIIIDTSELTLEQVVDVIMKELKKNGIK